MARITFQSDKAFSGAAPLSTLTEHNGTLYLSGVTAIDPTTGTLTGSAVEQAKKALAIIRRILEDYGSGMDDVLRATIYLKDMDAFQEVNAVYAASFDAPYPARTCVEVARLPMNALVEIDIIAAKNGKEKKQC